MINKIVTFIIFCNLAIFSAYADWTITTPATIAISTSQVNTSCSFDPTTGNFLAVWNDRGGTNEPAYSFYIPGTGWTAYAAINEETRVLSAVYSACDSSTGVFIATWADSNNNDYPTYSVYTPGSGWGAINTITSSIVFNNVFIAFNSVTGKFMAIWNEDSTDLASYAFYTPGTGWGDFGSIATSSVEGDVFIASDTITGKTMAAWSDIDSGFPFYSIFTPGTGWSGPTTIESSSYLYEDVYLSFNSLTGQTLATWGDSQNNTAPTYSIYTPGDGWGTTSALPGSTQVDFDMTSSFDPVTGQYLAIWSDSNNSGQITYSFYTPGSNWSSPATISASPEAEARQNVFLAYDSLTGQILATWTGDGDESRYPYYSFFDGPAPSPPTPSTPASPQNFKGKVLNNRFLTQTDRINKLNWTPANDPTVVRYLLRRNGVLIYTAPSTGPYTYEDHNRNKNVTYVYTLTSQKQNGVESTALTVTLR